MSDIPPPTLRIGQGPSSAGNRRKGISSSSSSGGRRAGGFPRDLLEVSENLRADGPQAPVFQNAPCGACKFLRRKCISGCIFAPHFGSDQGSARFAAVHKVFGASNVSKLLLHLPENCRNDAVVTISYEAQARLSDPVYGCVSTIIALQQQVATLQTELGIVQAQLLNSKFAVANAFNDSRTIQESQLAALTPAYSNASSASNNLMNINNCNTSNFDLGLGVDGGTTAAPTYTTFDPVNLTGAPGQDVEEEEEEEESHHFTNQLFHHHLDRKPFF